MKWIIIVINLLLLLQDVTAIAKHEKFMKKARGTKPTKGPKTLLDEFAALSPQDTEFIKQLDKQFKLHGDKIKIKVERENNTAVGNKNSKRTIEGSLGYGYSQNQNSNDFYFSQPRYVIYPYSQVDIPASKGQHNQHRETATDIEIQPSHSFEIKETANEQYETQHYNNQQQNHDSYNQQKNTQQAEYEDPVPVIVLRIPGPQKYALHLQALLQQYLELRATQYIKALEEQESQGLLMHPQHYASQSHQMAYVPMMAVPHMYNPYYQEQQQYQQQYYQQQAPEEAYHHQQQEEQHQQQQQQQSYYQQSQPEYHQQSQPEYHQPQPEYQIATSYQNFVTTPSYSEESHSHHEPEPLLTSENYPSDKHTRVIFKKKKNRHYSRPMSTAVPTITYVHEQEEPVHHQQEQAQTYYTHENPTEEAIITVTQRSKTTFKDPYNYHAALDGQSTGYKTSYDHLNAKRMAQQFSPTPQQQKTRRMVNKLKRSRNSAQNDKHTEASSEAPVKS